MIEKNMPQFWKKKPKQMPNQKSQKLNSKALFEHLYQNAFETF
jgi:hypothetical protein